MHLPWKIRGEEGAGKKQRADRHREKQRRKHLMPQSQPSASKRVAKNQRWSVAAPRSQGSRNPNAAERRGKLHSKEESGLRVIERPSRDEDRKNWPDDDRRDAGQHKSNKQQSKQAGAAAGSCRSC